MLTRQLISHWHGIMRHQSSLSYGTADPSNVLKCAEMSRAGSHHASKHTRSSSERDAAHEGPSSWVNVSCTSRVASLPPLIKGALVLMQEHPCHSDANLVCESETKSHLQHKEKAREDSGYLTIYVDGVIGKGKRDAKQNSPQDDLQGPKTCMKRGTPAVLRNTGHIAPGC